MSTLLGTYATQPRTRERNTWRQNLLVAAVILSFITVSVHSARLRPFWYDEMSTFFISSIPGLREMLKGTVTDGNPPLYFLLARLCLKLPIQTELALRIPAIAGCVAAAMCVYRFVRHGTSASLALLSMTCFLGSMARIYSIEARGYCILLAFAGLVLCCWQARIYGSKLAPIGIALGVTGAILTHQYGVLYTTLPIFAGEAIATVRRRRLDLSVIGSVLTGSLMLLSTFPPMLRGQRVLLEAIRTAPAFWARPQIGHLALYPKYVPPFVAIVALIVGLFAPLIYATGVKPSIALPAKTKPEEYAAVSTLALFLPIMLLVTHLRSGYFQERYAIGSAMGLAMLIGLVFSHGRLSAFAWPASLYCFTIALLGLWHMSKPGFYVPQLDPILLSAGHEYQIVVDNPVQFYPAWWYADDNLRQRLHFLLDPPYAKTIDDFVGDYSIALEQPYLPMKIDSYAEFVAIHSRFFLYSHGEHEWLIGRLAAEGWKIELVLSSGVRNIYLVTSPQYVSGN
jgi:hypothetical protein